MTWAEQHFSTLSCLVIWVFWSSLEKKKTRSIEETAQDKMWNTHTLSNIAISSDQLILSRLILNLVSLLEEKSSQSGVAERMPSNVTVFCSPSRSLSRILSSVLVQNDEWVTKLSRRKRGIEWGISCLSDIRCRDLQCLEQFDMNILDENVSQSWLEDIPSGKTLSTKTKQMQSRDITIVRTTESKWEWVSVTQEDYQRKTLCNGFASNLERCKCYYCFRCLFITERCSRYSRAKCWVEQVVVLCFSCKFDRNVSLNRDLA